MKGKDDGMYVSPELELIALSVEDMIVTSDNRDPEHDKTEDDKL